MMKKKLLRAILVIALLMSALLEGCKSTKEFTYMHPKDSERLLHVSLSRNSEDMFQLKINGKQILEEKLDLTPKGTAGWAMAGGWFESEPVMLSCSRDYVSIAATWCDFSIGGGTPIRISLE